MHTKDKIDWSGKEDMSHGIGLTINGAVFATVEGTDREAREVAEHLVLSWNEHDDLLAMCLLAESLFGSHIQHHIDNDTPLCKKCKINVGDAVFRIKAVLAKAKPQNGISSSGGL